MSELERYCKDVLQGKIVACKRIKQVCEMLLNAIYTPGEYHFDEEEANRHVEFIEKFCKQPTGQLGTPLKLELFQKARLQALFGFVDDNGIRQYNECLIIEGRKNGKALALDTEIPTPSGFRKMEDIHIGDLVFGDDGKPHKVTSESEIFENHDCYKVVFRGGNFIICDADHIWRVKNKKGKIVDKTTKELLHFKRPRKDGKGTEYLYRVPVTRPVEYEEKELPLDAYTLGVWLGDGSKGDTRITVSDADLQETKSNLETAGHTVKIYHNRNRAKSIGLDVVGVGKKNKTLDALRVLGVADNKHIPNIYLQSSTEQRIELLKGLMDTDGFCSKTGQCEFCQKDEKIVDQVRELLSSLGIVSSKREKTIITNGKKCHAFSVLFFVDKNMCCFKLRRKAERIKERLNHRMDWNSIIDIQKVDSVNCKCIAIDSDSHLYLATRNYIVTHNTTECASVEIDTLINDGEGAPQIYNIATMLDQAKLGFNACHKMIKQSPMLSKHIRKRAADLYFATNFGFIKALASNSSSLDGLDTHCAVIDELAAIKDRDIYDLIKQSMGARSQPILFCITTNGFVRHGIFDAQYEYACNVLDGKIDDPHFLPFIYELDDITEWDKEECWLKANPGLGTIKSYDYLRQMVSKAKDDPTFKPTVLVKDFNMVQTEESAYFRYEEINNEEENNEKFKYCIGGFDAADSIDLNAAVAICKRSGSNEIVTRQMFWLPEEQVLRDNGSRIERDFVPYRQWAAEGLLRLCPGNKCDKQIFLDWFLELRDQEDLFPLYIGYDPWHISDDLLQRFKMEFGAQCMIPVRQGVYSMSEPMKNIKAEFQAHNIVYQNNPIMKWCLMNLHAKRDVNNNVQPVKGDSPLKRIDGAVALIIAYKILQDKEESFVYLND